VTVRAPALAAVLLCAAPLHAAPVAVNTDIGTAGGAAVTAPAGWKMTRQNWGVALAPPESDTRLAIVDAAGARDAGAAVALAWRAFPPGQNLDLQAALPSAPREGWDEAADYQYSTPPDARADIEAIAMRAGDHWTVALLVGTDPTVEKRRADLRLIFQSLRPKNFRAENFAGRVAHALDAARVAALVAFVREGMRALNVPGAALALTDHGKVVYEGGLGVRQTGEPDAVDAHTLFMIASNTKGLTTLLLAALVDHGKLRWDEKVTEAYPAFRLGDPAATQEVLIKHLVCACTGLPRQDLEWVFNATEATPASETFKRLAGMRPTSAFGRVYQYSNLMAAAAGYVAASVAHPGQEIGAAYDTAMRDMIFAPLGMADTTFSFARALAGDHAAPHDENIDGHVEMASPDLNSMIEFARPAGGAWSSAHDMIRYVQDELTLGRLPDGGQLVSPGNLLQRRARGVPEGETAFYGLGLRTDRADGVTVVHHGGSLAGYTSDFFVVQDAGAGAVLLTNADNGELMLPPFRRRLLELLYDGTPRAEAELTAAARAQAAMRRAMRRRLTVPPEAAPADKLAAHYANAALGHIDVRHQGAGVVFDFGAWRSRVATRREPDGSVSFVTIDPAAAGKVFTMTAAAGLKIRDAQHEYLYRPVACGPRCAESR
jgi:CubicO group peptidase (beta-lactamase class C family)